MGYQTVNPATGEPIADYEYNSAERVDGCLAAAVDAFGAWRRASLETRATPLRTLASLLRERQEPLAALITREMGKPLVESRAEVSKCASACDYYASEAATMLAAELVATDATRSYVAFEPLGPVLLVMPWNFPLWQVIRQAAPALMAGNVCVLKHAPNVWGCAAAITRLFVDAGFPPGAFAHLNVDTDAVAALIEDARIVGVALTGSERAGRAVGAVAGRALKPMVLELGGSDAFVVLADADLDATLAGAMAGRFLNAGQSCISAKRFIVERAILAQFCERFGDAVRALRVGDPTDPSTQIGPMARGDLREALAAQVDASIALGARALVPGGRLDRPGYFYAPTLLSDVMPGMPAFDEEVFGPVVVVIAADDEDHAFALANQTRFGLGGSVWTSRRDADSLANRIEAGSVMVNGIVKSDPRLPFGGIKASGVGRELSRAGILSFVNQKTIWIR
jgi:succinate-semialdehyde dehydrogenase/glutarate-semialdehyde dehydrogenase